MRTSSLLLVLQVISLVITSSHAQDRSWILCRVMPQFCPPVEGENIVPSTSYSPSQSQSLSPIEIPAEIPTSVPTPNLTEVVSTQQSNEPSDEHSVSPSTHPSTEPSESRSTHPSAQYSESPSETPINDPTSPPTYSHRPNLIMIITDEHSLRTLGCYRDFMRSQNQKEQASVWGDGIEVETPNIDRLAAEGALFTNYYTVAPLCTPSRASFMSGLYPQKTGESDQNHGKIDDDVVTFAQVLQSQREYYTGYFGKWHLNGEKKPGWGNDQRKFGFEETKYQFNRGHYKFLDNVNGTMTAFEFKKLKRFIGEEEKHFTTDYLFDRGIEFMETAKGRDQPFAYVLSIPDPHSPNHVRQPYEDMYKDIHFSLPSTAYDAVRKDPGLPDWNYFDHDEVKLDDADVYLKGYEESGFYQNYMQNYFAMIKCIDDNVGKLLDYLSSSGLDKDTIIVFTSDHGNMAGEHGKLNKGRPYKTSAGIPFIIRHPDVVTAGKVINTARSSVDFAPSILSLMNANDHGIDFDGVDFTDELLNDIPSTSQPEIIFTFDTGRSPLWAAAIMGETKLVVSSVDSPWLFDLNKDPDELINYFDTANYSSIRDKLLDALFIAFDKHHIPLKNSARFIDWSTPDCFDSKDRIDISKDNAISCDILNTTSTQCSDKKIQKHCPVACGTCCTDSVDKVMWHKGVLKTCDQLIWFCAKEKVQQFCPSTCHQHTNCPDPGIK